METDTGRGAAKCVAGQKTGGWTSWNEKVIIHKAIGKKYHIKIWNEYSLYLVLDYFCLKSPCCVENKEAFYP